jgi:hypothetical protein
MKAKSALIVKIATAAVIIVSVTIIVLTITLNNIASDGVLENVLTDIVILVCLLLFVWITLLRDTPANDNDRYLMH